MADFVQNPEKEQQRVLSLHEGTNSRNVPWLITDNSAAYIENMLVNSLGAPHHAPGGPKHSEVEMIHPADYSRITSPTSMNSWSEFGDPKSTIVMVTVAGQKSQLVLPLSLDDFMISHQDLTMIHQLLLRLRRDWLSPPVLSRRLRT